MALAMTAGPMVSDSAMPASAIPLFDLALDIPHPAASSSCPPVRSILPPHLNGNGGGKHEAMTAASPAITVELSTEKSITRIARFAFPEYDDRTLVSTASEASTTSSSGGGGGGILNKYDIYQYNFTNQFFIFALQLSSGIRMYGHVRRYLPSHANATTRADVGRRGVRALVILTRMSGGCERFLSGILRTMEALIMEQSFLKSARLLNINGDDTIVMNFLHSIYVEHARRLIMVHQADCKNHQHQQQQLQHNEIEQQQQQASPKPPSPIQGINLLGIEFGQEYEFISKSLLLDTTKFHLATFLLRQKNPLNGQQPYSNPIETIHPEHCPPLLPLLRRLGPSHTIRLLSAVLCERRIILTSKFPSRLSACTLAITAMLAQGCMEWQHVFVPILPPQLIQHLAAPMPYIVGMLSQYVNNKELFLHCIPGGIGEVVIIDVDTNNGGGGDYGDFTIQVFNVNQPNSFVPDLLRGSITDVHDTFGSSAASAYHQHDDRPNYYSGMSAVNGTSGGGGGGIGGNSMNAPPAGVSLAECLGSDLYEILKIDKALTATTSSGTQTLQEAAGKASTLVRSALKGLKKKSSGHGSKSYKNQTSLDSSGGIGGDGNWNTRDAYCDDSAIVDGADGSATPPGDASANGGVDEFTPNAKAEEDVRIAFMSFFVCLLGDAATFLTTSSSITSGIPQPPSFVLDKDKFMVERQRRGEYEGTPLYSMLMTFVQSQMFEQYGKGRLAEVMAMQRQQQQQQQDHMRSTFSMVIETIRRSRTDYSILNVRRVVRQVVSSGPNRTIVQIRERARLRALSLTSKQGFLDGSAASDLAQLTEDCRDASGPLLDVMGVVWTRIRDSKGMNSKHALNALIVLHNLLLHGPLAAIVDACDGIDRVRVLKSYSNKFSGTTAGQIRSRATQIYELLVDWTKLFMQRRTCVIRRFELSAKKKIRLLRDSRLRLVASKFAQIHSYLMPSSCESAALPQPQNNAANGRPHTTASPNDLLMFSPAQQQASHVAYVVKSTKDLLNFNCGDSGVVQQPFPQQVNESFDMRDLLSVTAATAPAASGAPSVANGQSSGGINGNTAFDPFAQSAPGQSQVNIHGTHAAFNSAPPNSHPSQSAESGAGVPFRSAVPLQQPQIWNQEAAKDQSQPMCNPFDPHGQTIQSLVQVQGNTITPPRGTTSMLPYGQQSGLKAAQNSMTGQLQIQAQHTYGILDQQAGIPSYGQGTALSAATQVIGMNYPSQQTRQLQWAQPPHQQELPGQRIPVIPGYSTQNASTSTANHPPVPGGAHGISMGQYIPSKVAGNFQTQQQGMCATAPDMMQNAPFPGLMPYAVGPPVSGSPFVQSSSSAGSPIRSNPQSVHTGHLMNGYPTYPPQPPYQNQMQNQVQSVPGQQNGGDTAGSPMNGPTGGTAALHLFDPFAK